MSPVFTLPETSVNRIRAFVDRRRTRRFACGDTVEVGYPASKGVIATGTMHNISTGGVAIHVAHYVSPGTAVEIRGKRLQEQATVRHCTPAGSGFILGCEFRRPLLTLWF
jgi:hypothetical protein